MNRLLVHVEGETEEYFVNEVLSDHLIRCGYSVVSARIVGNSSLRDRRGGIRTWETVRKDIVRHLRQDAGAIASTMVDYYALPQSWPGRPEAPQRNFASEKAETVERALQADAADAPQTLSQKIAGHGAERRAFSAGLGREKPGKLYLEIPAG
jgi:hypothetical protein